MSHRIRFPLFLFLACFTFLILAAPDSHAVPETEQAEVYVGNGDCNDCPPPPGGGEGGDPEEILIRSRPAPPVDNGFGFWADRDSSSAWLIRLVNLVRVLR